MEMLKKVWEKVKFVWNKIIGFKGTKYIVVLGITAIVFAIVIVNSNSIFVIEGTSKENEKVVFIAVENKDNCYHGSKLETGKSEDYCELWYVVEGYKDKQSYLNGEAAVFNSDTDKETFYNGSKAVVPFHFSNENITSTSSMGARHRIFTISRRVKETMTRDDGSTYEKDTPYRPTVWYQLDKTNISKLESYTFGTFVELTKYQKDFNANYIRITFKLDDTQTRFFKDFEL